MPKEMEETSNGRTPLTKNVTKENNSLTRMEGNP